MPYIEIQQLTKDFIPPLSFRKLLRLDFKHTKPTRALDDISFSLKKGEILGVLGPNGAGKTTLLKIIATLVLPDQGKVTISGNRVGKNDEKIKSIIGLATSEERSFYWRLTGKQNLEFFASLYDLNKRQSESRIQHLLELFNLDYIDKRFDSYSTGMKRRLSIVRALLHNPEILLLDEPTKSLDYNSACQLRNFVKKETLQGRTIICATHNMEEAEDLCNLFLILHEGRIYGLGTLEELRKKISSSSATLSEIYLRLTQNV